MINQRRRRSNMMGEESPPLIIVPPRPEPRSLHDLNLASITPGRSLTSSVLGRGPTPDIKNHFTFEKRLGKGQFGTAHAVREISTGKRYACKTVPRSTLVSEEDVEDLRREVNIMYVLVGQPNVVQIHSCYEDRDNVHIVMELCEGGELFDEINRRILSGASVPFTEKDAARYAMAILTAVEKCHMRGIMHRDLKPENFLLMSKRENSVLKTADFGLATFFKPGETFSRVVGSALYMAPEIIRLYQKKVRLVSRYGAEVDIWSVGIVVYILLCGAHPFPAPDHDRSEAGFMKSILRGGLSFGTPEWRHISCDAKHLIQWMLDFDPKRRPNASEALAHPWLASAPPSPLPPKSVMRFRNFIQLVCLKKFRKDAVRSLALHFTDAELRVLLQHLATRDSSSTGQLSVEEFLEEVEAMAAESEEMEQEEGKPRVCMELDLAVKQSGIQGSTRVEFPELMTVASQLCQVSTQESLFKAFSLFDQDLSGFISAEELNKACRQFKLAPNLVNELTDEVNRNEKGSLDYNEFVALMRKNTGGSSRKQIESSLEDGSFRESEIDKLVDAPL